MDAAGWILTLVFLAGVVVGAGFMAEVLREIREEDHDDG